MNRFYLTRLYCRPVGVPADYTVGLTAFEMRSNGQVRSEATNLQKAFSDLIHHQR